MTQSDVVKGASDKKYLNLRSELDVQRNSEVELNSSMEIPVPNEIIAQILTYLSHGDLCNVSLVSRRMYNVAATPSLWAKLRVCRPLLAERGLAELITCERYCMVETIDLYQQQIAEQKLVRIIEQSMEMPGLKKIVLYDHVLTYISADLLAKAFTRLAEVVIGGTYLTRGQLTTILQTSLTSTSLNMLDLSNLSKISEDMWENTGYLPVGLRPDSVNRELSNVSDDILRQALKRLEIVSLKCNKLGLLQWNTILENTPGSNLKELDLSFNSEIIDIPGLTLAMAVASLRKVNLAYITLTDDQLLSIFTLIKTSNTLEDLNIGNIKLQDMPKEMLTVLCKLKVVNIEGTNLGNEQIKQILNGICDVSSSKHRLEKLDISRNSLQDIPSQLLADACMRLTHLNISDTSLTTSQCEAIFSAIPNSSMIYLDISGVRLAAVPAEILSKGVCGLREVDLSSTMTTTKQIIEILTKSKESETLKKVVGILMRNIPEHLERYAACLSMVTPFGNVNLRARRQEETMKILGEEEPTAPWLIAAGIHQPRSPPEASGSIPPPPPPPGVVNPFGNLNVRATRQEEHLRTLDQEEPTAPWLIAAGIHQPRSVPEASRSIPPPPPPPSSNQFPPPPSE